MLLSYPSLPSRKAAGISTDLSVLSSIISILSSYPSLPSRKAAGICTDLSVACIIM